MKQTQEKKKKLQISQRGSGSSALKKKENKTKLSRKAAGLNAGEPGTSSVLQFLAEGKELWMSSVAK